MPSKIKWHGKAIIALLVLFPMGMFLLKFSTIRYPFINARFWLAGHLEEDFGIALPASTTVLNSYWVGSHDPKEVFELQMSPADAVDMANQMRTVALARNYGVQSPPLLLMRPPYGPPTWWNSPPLPDVEMFTISLGESRHGSEYGVLYSPSMGKVYMFWGRS